MGAHTPRDGIACHDDVARRDVPRGKTDDVTSSRQSPDALGRMTSHATRSRACAVTSPRGRARRSARAGIFQQKSAAAAATAAAKRSAGGRPCRRRPRGDCEKRMWRVSPRLYLNMEDGRGRAE
ncbi:unnamed protein product [Lampetra fluviatilis]